MSEQQSAADDHEAVIYQWISELYPPNSLEEQQSLSRNERTALIPSDIQSIPLQYGETDIRSLAKILKQCAQIPSGT